jgi:hypothetical protein
MGFFTLLLQRSLLRKLLGRTRGTSQMSRSGNVLPRPFGKAALAVITAMLIKRALRRR